ncbi:Ankyrin Repeat Domain-Containing Protein 26 [Manis pentadactyla]|nr:Ankyrin Repeat Domain-Containing Protein 26 [Manis pentadactyla]
MNVEEFWYQIRSKDLGKLHRAVSMGEVARVEHILSLGKNDLNDKDKMNRTALRLACTSGHVEAVTLLVKRKCELNLRDNEERTPLIKSSFFSKILMSALKIPMDILQKNMLLFMVLISSCN